MSDLIKPNPGGTENVIDRNVLSAQGKAFFAARESATPASPPPSAPAESPAAPVVTDDPVPTSTLQSQVTVHEQPVSPVPQQQQAAPAEAGAPPQIVNLPDDVLVEVIIDGEKRTMPWGQAKSGVMLKQKFTKEMQQFRGEETSLRERAQMADRLERLVTDPDLFLRYAQQNPVMAERIAKSFGTTVAAATAAAQPPVAPAAPPAPRLAFQVNNPDEIVNMGELAAHLGTTAAELEKQFGARLEQTLEERLQKAIEKANEVAAAKVQEIEDHKEVTAYNTKIDETINGILDANPVLRHIPYINETLRLEVVKMQPRNLQEMFDGFNVVAQGIVESLEQTYSQSRQAAVIAKQEMEQNNIAAQTGRLAPNTTVVPPAPPSYAGKDGKFDFKQLRNVGKQWINNR